MTHYLITIAPQVDDRDDVQSAHTTIRLDTSSGQTRITELTVRAGDAGGLAPADLPMVDLDLLVRALAPPTSAAVTQAPTPALIGGSAATQPPLDTPKPVAPLAATDVVAAPAVVDASVPADAEAAVAPSRASKATKKAAGVRQPRAARTGVTTAGGVKPRAGKTTAGKATAKKADVSARGAAAEDAATAAKSTPRKASARKASPVKASAVKASAVKASPAKASAVKASPAKASARKAGAKVTAAPNATAAPKAGARKAAGGRASAGLRAYRRMPEAAEVLSAYEQAGTITALAEHYGVPRHTVTGWARRLRREGHAIGRA